MFTFDDDDEELRKLSEYSAHRLDYTERENSATKDEKGLHVDSGDSNSKLNHRDAHGLARRAHLRGSRIERRQTLQRLISKIKASSTYEAVFRCAFLNIIDKEDSLKQQYANSLRALVSTILESGRSRRILVRRVLILHVRAKLAEKCFQCC